jgi:uncharacterized protein (TIGR03790 family)
MRAWVVSAWCVCAWLEAATAAALTPEQLGVLYRRGDPASEALAQHYRVARGIPAAHLVGLTVPQESALSPVALAVLRDSARRLLPAPVRAVVLVWTRPYAAGCMSITTAIAAGYDPGFCEPGCARTAPSPLYDATSLDPATRLGWLPAMLLPAEDVALGRALVQRGVAADGTRPGGTVYLVATGDAARNVRAAGYADVEFAYGGRVRVVRSREAEVAAPRDVLAYFTGTARVTEMPRLGFRPGGVADHLTSAGGLLDRDYQTTALEWLQAGATGSYGTVTEPCNHVGKFPSPTVFLAHYLGGETLLEAYWKSVAMPGQGLVVGEPLARPFAAPHRGAAP